MLNQIITIFTSPFSFIEVKQNSTEEKEFIVQFKDMDKIEFSILFSNVTKKNIEVCEFLSTSIMNELMNVYDDWNLEMRNDEFTRSYYKSRTIVSSPVFINVTHHIIKRYSVLIQENGLILEVRDSYSG